MTFDPENEFDVVRYMKDVPKVMGKFDKAEFDGWAKRVEQTAQEICRDRKGKPLKLTTTHTAETSWVEVQEYDRESLRCLIVAIRRLWMSMPSPYFEWYNGWQALLEIKKKNLRG